MGAGCTTGDAYDRAAGILIPIRSGQTGERRNKIDTATVRNRGSKFLNLAAALDEPEAVAQPLDDAAAYIDGAFKGVLHFVADLPRHGGEEVVLREDGLVTDVQHDEATGAIGVLDRTRCEAHLAEERTLLVTGDTCDRHLVGEDCGLGVAIDLRARLHLRHHAARNVQKLEQIVIPLQGIDIEQHGTAGIRHIGNVHLSAGQAPDEPGVDVTEAQLAFLSALACTRHIVEDPFDLCAAEVSIDDQTRLLTDLVDEPLSLQLVAELSRAAVLPYDGVVDRLFRVDIPNDRRLTLVRDADGGDVETVDVDG